MWSGALTTAGGIACYGTLEGNFKCVDQKDGKELYKYKTPSGIIGNVFTYEHKGKQYIGVYSGVGGWAGIGLAAGLTNPTDGLGAVGGYAGLSELHRSRRFADRVDAAVIQAREFKPAQFKPAPAFFEIWLTHSPHRMLVM